jgi:hypothetical protein
MNRCFSGSHALAWEPESLPKPFDVKFHCEKNVAPFLFIIYSENSKILKILIQTIKVIA